MCLAEIKFHIWDVYDTMVTIAISVTLGESRSARMGISRWRKRECLLRVSGDGLTRCADLLVRCPRFAQIVKAARADLRKAFRGHALIATHASELFSGLVYTAV